MQTVVTFKSIDISSFIYGTFKSITSTFARYYVTWKQSLTACIGRRSDRMQLWKNWNFHSVRLDWQLKNSKWLLPINKTFKALFNMHRRHFFLSNSVYEFLADAGVDFLCCFGCMSLSCIKHFDKKKIRKIQMHLNTWNCIVKNDLLQLNTQKNGRCTSVEQHFLFVLISNDFDIFFSGQATNN